MRHLTMVVVLASACPTSRGYFDCGADDDCRAGATLGICEPTGRCSFADITCGSGRRYGEYSGTGYAQSCVDEGTDGAPPRDAPGPADAAAPCQPEGSFEALAAGRDHTCALEAGRVWCWGRNDTGQLGDGGTASAHPRPLQVLALDGIRGISAGGNFTCALSATKTVSCWGHNDRGQLGDGTQGASRSTPAPVRVLTDVDQLSTGSHHACAVKADGTVLCWGDNSHGQIGDGFTGNFYKEPVLARITSVVDVACGNEHTCALTSNGGVFCWGSNAHGEMGNPALGGDGLGGADQLLPTQLSLSPSVGDLSAGHGFTCALSSKGEAWCWGQNDSGQMGIGATSAGQATPSLALDVTDALALSTGEGHACAWKQDLSARCWGRNEALQVDGTKATIRLRPVPPNLDVGVLAMALGGAHTCALGPDGFVWCWGKNAQGQLGDGTTSDSPQAARQAVCL